MNKTMPFVILLQGTKATAAQLQKFIECKRDLKERLLYAKVIHPGILVLDYKTQGGYYVQCMYNAKGLLELKTHYSDYDFKAKKPLSKLFE
jgi:hypothetical protein